MKRVINLVALVMLVILNVLTSLSYAQEDNPGIGEILENVGKSEVILENTVENGENLENLELEKIKNSDVMQVEQGTTTTLLPGTEFNIMIKTLAGDSSPEYGSTNTTITQILKAGSIPSGVTTGLLSTSDSAYPVYGWYDGNGTIYYYTDANNIYMNEDSNFMFAGCSGLTGLDLSNWNTENVMSMAQMFGGCSSLENLNLDGWDFRKSGIGGQLLSNTSSLKILSMSGSKIPQSFTNVMGRSWGYPNNSIEEIDVSNWDLSLTTDINGLFGDMKALKTIKGLDTWNTSGVTDMSNMFAGDARLEGEIDLSNWNTENVTTMYQMFGGCSKLTGVNMSNIDLSNISNMQAMFQGDTELIKVNISGITPKTFNVDGMFDGCSKIEELDLSNSDFSNVSFSNFVNSSAGYSLKKINLNNSIFSGDMSAAFLNFGGLEIKLDGVNTVNVSSMNSMFFNCSKLTGLDLSSFDTSNVTSMSDMFDSCSNLKELDLSNFDTSSVTTSMGRIFGGCNKLEKLNMSGWDFSKMGSFDIMPMFWTSAEGLKKLDLTNAIFTGYLSFRSVPLLEEIKLDGVDTSNVTDMNQMFYNDRSLTGLDLSSFDTSKVTNINAIFNGCNNLEELNMSGWDFRNVSNSSLLMNLGNYNNSSSFKYPSLKKLNLTNTKYTGNMQNAFGGLAGLNHIILDGVNTNNVTNMNQLFAGDTNLTGLDLSNWNTSNVVNMSQMFGGCSNLEELNMSGWNFKNINSFGQIGMFTFSPIKNLNMTNSKFSGNMSFAFGGSNKIENIILDGVDTSDVTDMQAMFSNDSSLTGLDLSSFDTRNVSSMNGMFYNMTNLKTIYVSTLFDTTAVTSSSDMFVGDVNIVGGNGTKFDSGYTDKTYALIDKLLQTGYFTDKNAINVKFINTLDGTKTISMFAKGQKLIPPSVDGYHVVGGYLDENMTQEFDLNNGVSVYTEIYIKYERNKSSGGGGGGGGGGSTKPDTPKEDQKSADTSEQDSQPDGQAPVEPQKDKDTENVIQSETKGSEESSNTSMDSSDKSSEGHTYTQEFQQAYEFAHENGITTKDTIQSAQMNGKLTRIAMAKMLSQYAINVLGQTPDTSKTIKFEDVTQKKDADYDNGVTLAYQLGIMGQNMKNNNFRPNDEVTRAEFVTALSRLIYNTSDGEYKSTQKYYVHHMEKLKEKGIITKDDPKMKEKRGYVMIMLMRSTK